MPLNIALNIGRRETTLKLLNMGLSTLWQLTILFTFALISMIPSRHIQNSHSKIQQDASKSGKPGEYLWYKTDSSRAEIKFARSLIAKSHDSTESEQSGALPSLGQEDISGSAESSSEDTGNLQTSGSGGYPTSYMVDIQENTNVETSSVEPTGEASLDEHKAPAKIKQDREEQIEKSPGRADKPLGKTTNEQVSSESAYGEEEALLKEGSGKDNSNGNYKEEKITAPAVEKQVVNPKRRSEISRKSKVEKEDGDSEYEKLFRDFGTEGDLDPSLEDDDSDLDDSLSDEDTKLLISDEDEDSSGESKSYISRPADKSKVKHKSSQSSKTKEILARLDTDVFRGNNSEEHEKFYRKKHPDHTVRLNNHYDKVANQTLNKEGDESKALSHHAVGGIFNGSVSKVVLEAESNKRSRDEHHQQGKHDNDQPRRHPPHHHRRNDRHHHHHRRRHHHDKHHNKKGTKVQKDNAGENKAAVHQANSSASYGRPSIYYPYPAQYPAVQQLSPYQSYDATPKSEYAYHSLQKADNEGAVCLDGSTPGYYLRKGTGKGTRKWIIYLQGGAWCETKESCLSRSQTNLGSTLFLKSLGEPGGILSSDKEENSKFYNWNIAYLPYCDGSSFSGNRVDPVEVEGSLLYFRGFRILNSTISELLSDKDLDSASHVVFSGTSAGGLAVMLHADFVRSRLPRKVHFRTLADSGFFLDTGSQKSKGERKFRKQMQSVFKLHDCTDGVPQKCVEKMPGKDLWKCIFPQYFLRYVKSKIFIVNPLYDSWQLGNIWEIGCASNPYTCTNKEVKQIKKFKKATLKAMKEFLNRSNIGLFADSCIDHGQVVFSNRWNEIKVKTASKDWSISSSFIRWLQHPKKKLFIDDYDYPANPTCVSIDVDKRSEILTEGF